MNIHKLKIIHIIFAIYKQDIYQKWIMQKIERK